MSPQEIAQAMVTGLSAFLAANRETKAEILGEVVDSLTGTDPAALLDRVPGLTPEMSELLFDALKGLVVEKAKEMLGGE